MQQITIHVTVNDEAYTRSYIVAHYVADKTDNLL